MDLLLVWMVAFSPLLVMLAIFTFANKRNKKKSRLPFDYADIARPPAFSLLAKHRNHTLEFLLYSLLACAIFQLPFSTPTLLSLFNLNIPPTSFWSAAIIHIIICAYYIKQAVANFSMLRHLRLGIESEWAVSSILAEINEPQVRIFHDIQGPGFNIDHVLTYPGGVLAIETKGRRKPNSANNTNTHKVIVDGERLIFPHYTDKDTIAQATRQAKWLSSTLTSATGLQVIASPMVVIPGWFVELKIRPVVPVMNHKNVKKYYRKTNKPVFSETDLSRINHQLGLLSRRINDEF